MRLCGGGLLTGRARPPRTCFAVGAGVSARLRGPEAQHRGQGRSYQGNTLPLPAPPALIHPKFAAQMSCIFVALEPSALDETSAHSLSHLPSACPVLCVLLNGPQRAYRLPTPRLCRGAPFSPPQGMPAFHFSSAARQPHGICCSVILLSVQAVVAGISARYQQLAEDTLDTVRKTESSLKRLKTRQKAGATEAEGSNAGGCYLLKNCWEGGA